jgi:hypothetical protein
MLGFAAAIVIALAGGIWLLREIDKADILMGSKTYFDLGETQPGHGYVSFEGALGGAEMAFPNNIFKATCVQERAVCETADLHQIRSSQVSGINTDTYQITKWTPDLIEAVSSPEIPVCVKITLVIHRKQEYVEYVRAPRDNDSELCKAIDKRTIGWTIVDGIKASVERAKK